MMLKAILFDMDGVIIDSEDYIRDAAIEMFKEMGQQVKPEDFIPFIGAGENKYIGGVAEKYQLTIDIQKAKKRTYEIYDQMVKGSIQPLPGTDYFLALCHNYNLRTALVTSADRTKIEINLNALNMNQETFDVYVSGEDVKHLKPDPSIFIKTSALLGLNPADCLVIEDSVNGIRAAKKAGCQCIALKTSFSEENLGEADYIYDNLSTIPENIIHQLIVE